MSHDLKISARAEKTENKFTVQGGSKLEVFDEDGEKLYEGEFKSFTSNFLKLLYGSMVGAGTAKAKDLNNSDVKMNSFPQSSFNISGGAGVKKFGVVVGTNSTAVSVSDYNITVPVSLTVNNTVVSASSVGADSISVEISRQINNSSGSTVSLKEAGLICGSIDETNTNVLIARDLLDITLENGKKSVWRYTINFNFANDAGGFVKSFADKMFSDIFEEVTTADWTARESLSVVVFNNKIWILGGKSGSTYYNDVWYSSDGITWIQVTTSSPMWSARAACAVVFDNKMWVLGGAGGGNIYNDVWYSTDGVTWIQATSSAAWPARSQFGAVVFDNKMWVFGGWNISSNFNDVWYSTDGVTWIQATSSAAWSARRDLQFAVFENKIWILGGYASGKTNDIWHSSDGVTWSQETLIGNLPVISARPIWVFQERIFIAAPNLLYASNDGIIWEEIAELNSMAYAGQVVFNNKMWVMGGWLSSSITNKVFASVNLISEIKPGSSDSAFSATGTALGALIADGSGSGELVYGAMPCATTIEPTVSGNKTTFSIAREFTNNSGGDITVREVGLFSGSDMFARLILAAPVTIVNGGSEIITVDFETEV